MMCQDASRLLATYKAALAAFDKVRCVASLVPEHLTHQEALEKNLKIMDATAFALARENHMPIIVFSIQEQGAIETVLRGKGHFTTVG